MHILRFPGEYARRLSKDGLDSFQFNLFELPFDSSMSRTTL